MYVGDPLPFLAVMSPKPFWVVEPPLQWSPYILPSLESTPPKLE